MRIYIIWMPTLKSDNQVESVLRSIEFSDSRLSYYWDPEFYSGYAWQEVFKIGSIAWDVYLVYDSETFLDSIPEQPNFYMHQLNILPQEFRLDPEKLTTDVLKLLR